jgi:hypothetical protein
MKKLVAFAVVTFASISGAFAAKGPIWEMKLPIVQRALLEPYAAFALRNAGETARDARFYEEYLARARSEGAGALARLKLHPERRAPIADFSFPFYNFNDGMADVAKSDFGFCLGFSFTLRKFNLLATYASERPRLAHDEDYFPLIDRIADNRPATIPGYANLFQLASTPAIAHYIKIHIADQWAQRNVSRKGLDVYADGFGSLRARDITRVEKDVRRILDLGVNPIIYFALESSAKAELLKKVGDRVCELYPKQCETVKDEIAKSQKGGLLEKVVGRTGLIHVVQVYDLEIDARKRVYLHVWDINSKAENAAQELILDPATETGTYPLRAAISASEEVSVMGKVKAVALHPSERSQIGEMLYHLANDANP